MTTNRGMQSGSKSVCLNSKDSVPIIFLKCLLNSKPMVTKEEQIRKIIKAGFQSDYNREDVLVDIFNNEEVIENILLKSEEGEKIDAIGFAEWLLSEKILPRDTNWFDAGKHYTSSELYTLYQQSKNKTP